MIFNFSFDFRFSIFFAFLHFVWQFVFYLNVHLSRFLTLSSLSSWFSSSFNMTKFVLVYLSTKDSLFLVLSIFQIFFFLLYRSSDARVRHLKNSFICHLTWLLSSWFLFRLSVQSYDCVLVKIFFLTISSHDIDLLLSIFSCLFCRSQDILSFRISSFEISFTFLILLVSS